MRLLFVKHALVWPRSSGHDVHTYSMMRACQDLGHQIALATVVEPSARALDGLHLTGAYRLDGVSPPDGGAPGTSLQKRFRSFWGIPEGRLEALRQAVGDVKPDAVIVGGLDALPYFPVLSGTVRVWYAADEWAIHHLSQLRLTGGEFVENARSAVVKGLYEWAHRHVVDRTWVVTDTDRRAMRWLAGMAHVDVIPNGVDAELYRPTNEPIEEKTAAFWGRLDFGPNIQALEWFCHRVWPAVRARVPEGRFTIFGFQPSARVERLAEAPGITLVPDLPDLRQAASRKAVAVLPFVSGAGIKNNLLEAAAMGMPVVCTTRATKGLRVSGEPPFAVAASADAMAARIVELWLDPARRQRLGRAARVWVVEHHTWQAAARQAVASIGASIAEHS
jgi:glycosyltransferase involved in cell wall biosynthesis